MTISNAVYDLFRESLPHHPFCSDDKTASLIRNVEHALRHEYIQANPPQSVRWLIFDVDREGAAYSWYDKDLPPPSWVATDPATGRGHIAYGLRAPVFRIGNVRPGPLRYLAAIETAYCDRLGADPYYAGLITKNPAHERWRVWCPANDPLYDLGDLADYVDLPTVLRRRVVREIPAGMLWRNVSLFDELRYWAYAAIKEYYGFSPFVDWHAAVQSHAQSINVFPSPPGPLSLKEVRDTAKSVAKWTWDNITRGDFREFVIKTHTSEIQAERGRLSGIARRKASLDARAHAVDLRLRGKSTHEIAATLGVSQSTVSRWLRA